MNKTFSILLIMCCCLLTVQAQIKEYTTDNVPNVRLQNKMNYISNPDQILSSAACDSIDRMLYALEQKTGIETAVVVLPSIGSEDCFDFAFNLGSKWGVGKKGKDNGLIILLVTDQRCIQFVTGYGLEGDLPDALCKRIQSRYMIPYLKKGDWNNGMVAGVRAVCARLDGSMSNDEAEKEGGRVGMLILTVFGFLLLGGIFGSFAVWQTKRCPNCGKHKLMRTDSKIVSRANGVKTEDETYTCQNCKHKLTRRKQSYDEHYKGGGGGPFIGGFGGGFGGGSGGGFSGGSFGGGGFGGGGSGSRF